jgi:hypothetical protein
MAMKKRPSFVLRFTTTDLRVAATRKQVAETGKEIVNKRPPVKPVVLLAPPIRGLAAAFSRRRWSFVGKERFRQSLSRRQFVNWWTTTRGGGFLLQ